MVFSFREDDTPSRDEISVSPTRLPENEGESRKKKGPQDRAYYIVKEFLTTERTYKKDLEVLNIWLKEELEKENIINETAFSLLFQHIQPIYDFHIHFLKDLEMRHSQWDGRSGGGNATNNKTESQKMGDVMLKNIDMLEVYDRYIQALLSVLENLDAILQKNKKIEQIYRDFELQKVCYLPLTSFILKPLHRLHHYHLLLDKLIRHYGNATHHDYRECMTAKAKFSQAIKQAETTLVSAENFTKLMELQRDLVGIDNLVQPGREFIREGCLQKLSKKGYQQRMFFLFNDVLLYTNRTTSPILQFKVHGQMPLRSIMVEETESRMGAANCFTIYGANRYLKNKFF